MMLLSFIQRTFLISISLMHLSAVPHAKLGNSSTDDDMFSFSSSPLFEDDATDAFLSVEDPEDWFDFFDDTWQEPLSTLDVTKGKVEIVHLGFNDKSPATRRGIRDLTSEKPDPPVSTTDTMISRPNIGFFAVRIGVVNTATSTWQHMWELPPVNYTMLKFKHHTCFRTDTDSLQPLGSFLTTICKVLTDYDQQMDKILESAVSEVQNLTRTYYQILRRDREQQTSSKRKKRGLFDFVGKIQSTLFGVATEDDMKGLRSNMKALREHAETQFNLVSTLSDKLVSFTKIVDDRFDVVSGSITNLTGVMNRVINATSIKFDNIDSKIKALQGYTIDLTMNLLQAILDGSAITNYRVQVKQWVDQWKDMYNGMSIAAGGILSPILIPPWLLTETLMSIESNLKDKGMKLVYPSHQINVYYQQPLASLLIAHSAKIILRIPVTKDDAVFSLWRTATYPVLLTYDTSLETELMNIPSYIISSIGPGSPRIAEISEGDLALCSGSTIRECRSGLVVPSFKSASCIRSLILNDNIKDVAENCQTGLVQRMNGSSFAQHITGTIWAIQGQSEKWILRCPGQVDAPVDHRRSGIISLPCYCSLLTGDLDLPPGVTSDCASSNTAVYWPTYNAWLATIYPELDRKGILTSLTYEDELPKWDRLVGDLPELKDVVSSFVTQKKIYSTFQTTTKFDLESQINKTKKTLDLLDTSTWGWEDVRTTVTSLGGVSLALSVVSFVLSVCVCLRTRPGYFPAPGVMLLLQCLILIPAESFEVHHIKGDDDSMKVSESTKEEVEEIMDMCHVTKSHLVFILVVCVFVLLIICTICLLQIIILLKLRKSSKRQKCRPAIRNTTGIFRDNSSHVYADLSFCMTYKYLKLKAMKTATIHIGDIISAPNDLVAGDIERHGFSPIHIEINQSKISCIVPWPFGFIHGRMDDTYELPTTVTFEGSELRKAINDGKTPIADVFLSSVDTIYVKDGPRVQVLFHAQSARMDGPVNQQIFDRL